MDRAPLQREWRHRLEQIGVERLRPMTLEKALGLLGAALDARDRAYAPYSKLAVGAAILCADGEIHTGANVENASYGATMCAERTAAFTAVGAGCREFVGMAVTADFPRAIPPCGCCRQVLAEFTRRAPVIMANLAGNIEVRSTEELLPLAFEMDDPKKG